MTNFEIGYIFMNEHKKSSIYYVICFIAGVIVTSLLFIFFKPGIIVQYYSLYKAIPLRNFLEYISFLCSPILVIVAILGLRQLELARRQIKVNLQLAKIANKRDSLKMTVEKCCDFAGKIIDKYREIDAKIKENGITSLVAESFEIQSRDNIVTIKVKQPDLINQEREKIDEIMPKLMELSNLLEAYAIPIVTGIADDETAFLGTGIAFCNLVEKCMIHIYLSGPKFYNYIITLYSIWKDRIENEARQKMKERLAKKIEEIEIKPTTIISSIGTGNDMNV